MFACHSKTTPVTHKGTTIPPSSHGEFVVLWLARSYANAALKWPFLLLEGMQVSQCLDTQYFFLIILLLKKKNNGLTQRAPHVFRTRSEFEKYVYHSIPYFTVRQEPCKGTKVQELLRSL